MEDVIRERRVRRERNLRESFLEGNKALLSDLAHFSDVAARQHKIRTFGSEANDVYNEVAETIMRRITQGETWQAIVDQTVEGKAQAFPDTSDRLAHKFAIGKLCAAAAMRLIRAVERERPVGDATAVMGEEVQTEQRELSEEESVRGNDRQMTAVLSRKALHRGIHRADVYGVADASRGYMKDNCTRFLAETDAEVTSALFDSNWTPETEVQRMAWMVAFGGDSVADVLFGAIPNIDATLAFQAVCLMRTFRLFPVSMTHLPEADMPDIDPDLVRNTYPTRYPYKPLVLANTRTKRPDRITSDHRSKCGACRAYASNNPFVVQARKDHELREAAKKDADPAYVPKPYKMYKMGKNCPWGKVLRFRSLDTGVLLPESASEGTYKALRRGLVNFRQMVLKARNQYWSDFSSEMVLKAQVRAYLEERDGIGTKVPTETFPARITQTEPFTRYSAMWPEEVVGGKEARRFAIPTYDTKGNRMDNLVDLDLDDAFSIELAKSVTENLPDYSHTPFLPGAERTNGYLLDMRDGWIKVSNYGNADHDGITGTFVIGLPGLLEWTRAKNNARKMVKFLIGMRGTICLSLAN